MEHQSETKTCQNCKNSFTIEPEDFSFYEKISSASGGKVPPPTFCPECRLQRKMLWRNERSLYRKKCDAQGHDEMLVSMYPQEFKTPVYDQKYWHGDDWDPMKFGFNYDFSINFFNQLNKLISSVPTMALINLYDVKSDYCNYTYQSKNCYLNFASDINEDSAYLYHSIENRNCFDMLGSRKNEKCFGLIDCERCYESEHLILCEECINCRYDYDCRSCQNCVGCVGLRSAKYCILNKQYSEEEYKKELENLKLGTLEGCKTFTEKFLKLLKKHPRKFSNSRHTVNSKGDYLNHVKNCTDCFDVEGPGEDLHFVVYGVTNMKNIYDSYAIGMNLENSYEVFCAGDDMSDVAFSANIWSSFNCRYDYYLKNCSDCFGCIGLRNKKYCILNKQYTKEEYEELVPKIIKHMNDMPYIDSKGRIYKYGEFFPAELSPFAYNESIAQEYFPLTKEEVLKQGYKWKDREARNYQIDLKTEDLLDNIKDVNEDIINKVIECEHRGACNEQCTEAFKIISNELQFYKRMNLPLPRLCPNCRHYQRLKQRNPLKLWHRVCMCDKENHHNHKGKCEIEFETSYAPDRPEIVYCEKCYQQEVY
ncbi:hypothetical protein A3B93_00590 [Candidatus Nomurabacteria bacterium RIFCSPHIGHO2_02_FULL_42_24]|uniref:Uncharacterized protein n=1 Tax=Candidatus Nomurabacteria bacterium RIFCSPHIGHO2_02_FULL_42_24 TaxID=1801757 RepID=A0A1F6WGU3_9BACT|nr:MAG: hypothetical protein A3B93_00590 [Candidatus Nomurabacteria bacterium RIFCSPHIGHO2_02_FULL_42_24]